MCNNIENYDVKILQTTRKQCGQGCTKLIGCYAYGYDEPSNNCYLSKSYILGQPLDSVYQEEYNESNFRCNKIKPIQNMGDAHVPEVLKMNAFYNCGSAELGDYHLEVLTDKIYQTLDDFEDINKLTVPSYNVESYNWNTDRNRNRNNNRYLKDKKYNEANTDDNMNTNNTNTNNTNTNNTNTNNKSRCDKNT